MSVSYVDNYGIFHKSTDKVFNMIDNYLYLYHTDTLIILPTFPEQIQDSLPASFTPTTVLARSAPTFSYSGSGPRSLNVDLHLHRDMMNQINTRTTQFKLSNKFGQEDTQNILNTDYIDLMTNQLQAIALPRYAASEKMVNPPQVAIRFGNEIYCKGIVDGGVNITYSGPILVSDKYAEVHVGFTIKEIDPYDADSVMVNGSFRGLNRSLERNHYKGR